MSNLSLIFPQWQGGNRESLKKPRLNWRKPESDNKLSDYRD